MRTRSPRRRGSSCTPSRPTRPRAPRSRPSCSSSTTRVSRWRRPTTTPPCRRDSCTKATAQLSKLRSRVASSARVTALAPASERLEARRRGSSRRRRVTDVWGDRVFRAVALGAGLSVLAILALIAVVTTKQSWPVFRHEGFSFITSTKWDPAHDKFGALAFIYGTVVASIIGIVLAVPLSLGIALFTTELAPRRLAQARGLPRRPPGRDPVGRVRAVGARRVQEPGAARRTSTSPTRSESSRCWAASSADRRAARASSPPASCSRS